MNSSRGSRPTKTGGSPQSRTWRNPYSPPPRGKGDRLLPVHPIQAGRGQRVEHRLQRQEAPTRLRGGRREDPAEYGDRRARDEEGEAGRRLWRGGLGAPGDAGKGGGVQVEARGAAEVHPGPEPPVETVCGQDQIKWKQITR